MRVKEGDTEMNTLRETMKERDSRIREILKENKSEKRGRGRKAVKERCRERSKESGQ